jgi:hypothetical protein
MSQFGRSKGTTLERRLADLPRQYPQGFLHVALGTQGTVAGDEFVHPHHHGGQEIVWGSQSYVRGLLLLMQLSQSSIAHGQSS